MIVLRGIGSSPANAGFDQAVAVSVDGVQTGRARIIDFGLLDLQQIEVMKGPQALFFGKNSPAGVISITSASPTSEFEGYVRAGFEFEADEFVAEGVVSGPLTNSLSGRIAFRYSEMDGWLRNTAGQLQSSPFAGPTNLPQAPDTTRPGDENFVGRVSLALSPEGSPFSATLKIAGMKHTDDGPSAGQQVVNCGAFSTPVVVYAGIPTVAVDPFGDCELNDRYSNGGLPNGYADNWPLAQQFPYTDTTMMLGGLTMNYGADRFAFTSVTGVFNSDPMPIMAMLSIPAFARIDKAADLGNALAKGLVSYWVGQGVGLIDAVRPAAAVVQEFKQEFADAIERLTATIES